MINIGIYFLQVYFNLYKNIHIYINIYLIIIYFKYDLLLFKYVNYSLKQNFDAFALPQGSPGRTLPTIFPVPPDALAPRPRARISVPAPWPGTAERPPRQKCLPPEAPRHDHGGGISIRARGATQKLNPVRQGGGQKKRRKNIDIETHFY
jgi:hypothetical protein